MNWINAIAIAGLCGLSAPAFAAPQTQPSYAAIVKELKKSEVQGLKIYSPDGRRYLINKEDENGVHQVYVGRTGFSQPICITNKEHAGRPKPERMKMQANWHPSGKWILMAVERDQYTTPPILGKDRNFVKGELQCGIWTNMYAVSPDGEKWFQLTDFKSGVPGTADGYTGPAFTPNGKNAVWSQIIDGNIFAYWPFGKWQLIAADFDDKNGTPKFTNQKDITPAGMNWNEPGNFHPDGESLLITGSTEKDAQGMDQYILNIRTGALTNLTNSPTVWDEHGVFSPDGKKILFMSAYPYRDDPKSSKVLSIKAEFMLMDKDGGNLIQLTHFRTPGYPEYSEKGGIAAMGAWSPDGRSICLRRLFFPEYEDWTIVFQRPDGAAPSLGK